MKTLLLVIATGLSLHLVAQDWSLFPYKQKSYFSDDLFVMDSIKVTGQDSILYFRKNLNLKAAGSCYHEAVQNNSSYYNMFYIDSLLRRGDTVFYFNELSNSPFYLLPKATVGQSWTISSDYIGNDYDQITINCVSNELETFLGITDSVKTFYFTPNGSSTSQTPISNFQMKLSKSYGLVEIIPFDLFLYHPPGLNFTASQLIGIGNMGTTFGYRQPKFHDYFHLSAGDILRWQRHSIPESPFSPQVIEYYLDSITNVQHTQDSVVYTYDRTTLNASNQLSLQSGKISTFTKDGFESIVETAPDWIGFGNNQYGYAPGGGMLIWQSNDLNFTVDSVSLDTNCTFSFSTDVYVVDTITCQTGQASDIGFGFTVNTRAGITQHCYYMGGWDCTTLLGSRISGVQVGGISLSVDDLSMSQDKTLSAFPNPSNDFLFIDLPENAGTASYEIYNNLGVLVQQGEHSTKGISVADLKGGLYIIQVVSQKEISQGKFIKN